MPKQNALERDTAPKHARVGSVIMRHRYGIVLAVLTSIAAWEIYDFIINP